jgi:RHS repeat-associated protein
VFGQPTILTSDLQPLTFSALGNRFLFTGREYLAALNLYDYRNRVYSPALGRFLQTDPIGFAAGDENIYRYVSNDPAGLADALGLAGHHFVPREIFDTLPAGPARDVFNRATTGPIPGPPHGWSGPHKAYNEAVKNLFNNWLEQKGISARDLTKAGAEKFVDVVKNSKCPEISSFLDDIAKKIAANSATSGLETAAGRGARGGIGAGAGRVLTGIGIALGLLFDFVPEAGAPDMPSHYSDTLGFVGPPTPWILR